jgi:hypothetical protein
MSDVLDILDTDPVGLPHERLIEGLQAAERLKAAAEAWSLQALAVLAREPAPELEKQWVRSEIAVALRWSDRFASARIDLSERVVDALPNSLAALADGRVSLGHVQAIAAQSFGLDALATHDLEDDVLSYAESHTIADTRRKVKRALLRIDPELAAERTRQGVAERDVWARPDDVPGLSRVGALLPADGAAELMAALDELAARPSGPDDERTVAQRRADALVQLGRDVLAGGCSHCDRPRRALGAAVQVTVALSTLLGLDEQAGELNGEPIPAELARALAHDETATWRRLVTDSLGELRDYGRMVYKPPAPLHDFVQARDRRCRFPGCTRAADSCDLDHALAWTDAGATNQENLVCLCERHHYLKHSDIGWRLVLWPDGTCVWTSPSGQTILTGPATYPIDNTAVAAVVVSNDSAAAIIESA